MACTIMPATKPTQSKFWNYVFIHKATGQFLDQKL